jgi:hypothetical protein
MSRGRRRAAPRLRVEPGGLVAVAGMTGIGATSPFAQASLNNRLLHAYLPLVRGGAGSGVACAIVVMKGKATRMLRIGRRAGQ